MKNKKGFTLIELLAVIVILAILAFIAIPIVINIITDSRENSHKRSIETYGRSVENAIALWQAKNDSDPSKYLSDYEIKTSGEKVVCDNEIQGIDSDDGIELTNCYVVDSKGNQKSKEKYNIKKGQVSKVDEDSNDSNAVEYLLSKTNHSSVTHYNFGSSESHQMYTFSHPATEQTGPLTDYRYIGNDPYNYVNFNNEVWRIIGIFTVEDGNGNLEERIKIIKNKSIGSKEWDSNNINEWNTATLNIYLNGDYYNNSLNTSSKEMIKPAVTYLGGSVYNSTTHFGSASDIYIWERGTLVDSGRSVKSLGVVTLMYPSDYYYPYANGIDDMCFSNGCRTSDKQATVWIAKHPDYNPLLFVSPYVNGNNSTFSISGHCLGLCTNRADISYDVYPVVYLKSSVKISGGDGTSVNPYKFKI